MGGRPQSVIRLVRFNFPVEYAIPEHHDLPSKEDLLNQLQRGDFIAVEPRTSQFKRVHVARIERVYREQSVVEVLLYHIPPSLRFGPWTKRQWAIWTDSSEVRKKEVVTGDEILCKVKLVEQALDVASLEKLATLGIDTGKQPRRDHSLPPRTF